MAKNTFIMARDLLDDEDLEIFSDEELGQILKAIYRFINHGKIPEFEDKGLYYIFKRFSKFNDENEQKYQSKVDGIMKARENNPKVQTADISDVTENRKNISDNRTEISDNRKTESDSSSVTDTVTVTVTDTVIKEKENKEKESPLVKRFEVFWSAYPKRVGKGAAFKAFEKLHPSQALLDKMIQAIDLQKESYQWKREDGQYIPYPSTWLNQSRWEDDVGSTTAPLKQSKWGNNISDIGERNNDYARIMSEIPDPLAGF